MCCDLKRQTIGKPEVAAPCGSRGPDKLLALRAGREGQPSRALPEYEYQSLSTMPIDVAGCQNHIE